MRADETVAMGGSGLGKYGLFVIAVRIPFVSLMSDGTEVGSFSDTIERFTGFAVVVMTVHSPFPGQMAPSNDTWTRFRHIQKTECE
jgi:hypothetical protein